MRVELARRLLAVGLLVALAAPARAENPCVGPTPFDTYALGGDESGIGGTGLADPDGIGGTGRGEPDSGIGGTGRGDDESGIGGTGIYGTVTAFGSVCVNGLRVHYGDDVKVEVDGAGASARDLAVGQVVFLVAHGEGAALRTRHIQVWSALRGRVDAPADAAGTLRVDGELVVLLPGTVFGQGQGASSFAVGDFVSVSGLRDAEGRLVASRVERAPEGSPRVDAPAPHELVARSGVERVSIESYLHGVPERLSIAGLRVDLPPKSPARPGLRVRATGRVLPTGVLRIDRPERPRRPRSDLRPPLRPDAKPTPVREPLPMRPDRPELPERPERPEIIDRVERPAIKDALP